MKLFPFNTGTFITTSLLFWSDNIETYTITNVLAQGSDSRAKHFLGSNLTSATLLPQESHSLLYASVS
jgi:hypothetical protein